MELGHLPYKKSTFEDYVGIRGLEKYGKKKWRRYVADVVKRLVAAIEPDQVVLGGGNVNKLKELPSGCRVGDNSNAFVGGFRLWDKAAVGKNSARPKRRPKQLTRSLASADAENSRTRTKSNSSFAPSLAREDQSLNTVSIVAQNQMAGRHQVLFALSRHGQTVGALLDSVPGSLSSSRSVREADIGTWTAGFTPG